MRICGELYGNGEIAKEVAAAPKIARQVGDKKCTRGNEK